jgi:hypothetical protein
MLALTRCLHGLLCGSSHKSAPATSAICINQVGHARHAYWGVVSCFDSRRATFPDKPAGPKPRRVPWLSITAVTGVSSVCVAFSPYSATATMVQKRPFLIHSSAVNKSLKPIDLSEVRLWFVRLQYEAKSVQKNLRKSCLNNYPDTVGEFPLHAARVAKREVRVAASGRLANHMASRSRLRAAAMATFCSPTLANPRYRARRNPSARVACDKVPSTP